MCNKCRCYRAREANTFSFPIQLSARVSIEASVPVALTRDELRPLLLRVNRSDALKLLSRFLGDHLVEGALDLGPVCHRLPVWGNASGPLL